MPPLRFIIVERTDDNKEYPVFAGPFASRQAAKVEAKQHHPQHGGFIEVIPESASWAIANKPVPKQKRRRVSHLRVTRRNSRR